MDVVSNYKPNNLYSIFTQYVIKKHIRIGQQDYTLIKAQLVLNLTWIQEEVCLAHLPSHLPRTDHFCIVRLIEAAFDGKGHLCHRDQHFVDGCRDPHADMDLLFGTDLLSERGCIYHCADRDPLSVVGCTGPPFHRNHLKEFNTTYDNSNNPENN
jgi:hypothetical protein